MRVLEFKQSESPDPDYRVIGMVRFWGGLGGAYVLVREVDAAQDEMAGGDESGGNED